MEVLATPIVPVQRAPFASARPAEPYLRGGSRLSEAIGIPGRLAADVVREQVTAADTWIEKFSQLPFGANTIRNLRRLARSRIRHIQPETQQRTQKPTQSE